MNETSQTPKRTFRTRLVNSRLIEQVKHLVGEGDRRGLRKLIDQMKPADVADLIEHLNPEERLFILQLLEPEGAGEVLVEVEPPYQERILQDLDTEVISHIVQELESDDAADLVGDLPAERVKEIIESVGDDVSEDLEKLLPYPQDTAGGIMGLEFVAVEPDVTVQDAIETIRRKRLEVEEIYYLYVIDAFGRLMGVVSLKNLILEAPEQNIRDILNPDVICVDVDADQEEVVQLVKKYDLVSIPVVDDHHRMVGRITHDDIIDVMEDEADEDITRMAGVLDYEISEESTVKISKARLPWLLAGLFGGLVAALVIDQFTESLEKMIALSFFFPVIMAMGGNTGTQAATVIVRGLATGDISMISLGKRLWMELRVALINGLICGVLLGFIVSLWLSDGWLGGIVAVSLVMIVLTSGFIGSAVPMALRKLNVDPALATGPFVTTSNDILGLLIYLGFVTLYLSHTPG